MSIQVGEKRINAMRSFFTNSMKNVRAKDMLRRNNMSPETIGVVIAGEMVSVQHLQSQVAIDAAIEEQNTHLRDEWYTRSLAQLGEDLKAYTLDLNEELQLSFAVYRFRIENSLRVQTKEVAKHLKKGQDVFEFPAR
jgi:hypothetical protein